MTHVKITISLSNPGSTGVTAQYEGDLPHTIPDEQISPRANKALEAAEHTLGMKVPE